MSRAMRSFHNSLVTLFFRLYAANLRRTWRNSPKAAWLDAIFTMDSLMIIPTLSLVMAFWAIAIHWLPESVGAFGMAKGAGLCITIVVAFSIDTWFTRYINQYSSAPIARDSFSSTADRVTIVIAFIASFSFAVVMVGFIALIRK